MQTMFTSVDVLDSAHFAPTLQGANKKGKTFPTIFLSPEGDFSFFPFVVFSLLLQPEMMQMTHISHALSLVVFQQLSLTLTSDKLQTIDCLYEAFVISYTPRSYNEVNVTDRSPFSYIFRYK